jgi:hypothetical protein
MGKASKPIDKLVWIMKFRNKRIEGTKRIKN